MIPVAIISTCTYVLSCIVLSLVVCPLAVSGICWARARDITAVRTLASPHVAVSPVPVVLPGSSHTVKPVLRGHPREARKLAA